LGRVAKRLPIELLLQTHKTKKTDREQKGVPD